MPATAVLLLLQLPPVDVVARVVTVPAHKLAVPVITSGIGLIVTPAVAMQPVGSV
jgi:hypothetical protein